MRRNKVSNDHRVTIKAAVENNANSDPTTYITQAQLAEELNLSQATISRLMRSFENQQENTLQGVNNSESSVTAATLHTLIDALQRDLAVLTTRLDTLEKGKGHGELDVTVIERVMAPLNHRVATLENGQKNHEKRVSRVEAWKDSVDRS